MDENEKFEEGFIKYPIIQCPLCQGEGMHLGTMGFNWFQCRQCGIMFNDKPNQTLTKEQDARLQRRKRKADDRAAKRKV